MCLPTLWDGGEEHGMFDSPLNIGMVDQKYN